MPFRKILRVLAVSGRGIGAEEVACLILRKVVNVNSFTFEKGLQGCIVSDYRFQERYAG